MITLSTIVSIVWIVLTAQALYRRIEHNKKGPYCNGYYPKCTPSSVGLGDFQFIMPELTLYLIILAIGILIFTYLP